MARTGGLNSFKEAKLQQPKLFIEEQILPGFSDSRDSSKSFEVTTK